MCPVAAKWTIFSTNSARFGAICHAMNSATIWASRMGKILSTDWFTEVSGERLAASEVFQVSGHGVGIDDNLPAIARAICHG